MEQSQGIMPNSQEQEQWSDPSLDVFPRSREGRIDLFAQDEPLASDVSEARGEVHDVFNSNMLSSQLDNGGEYAAMSPEEIRDLIDRNSETIVELARRAVLGTEANN